MAGELRSTATRRTRQIFLLVLVTALTGVAASASVAVVDGGRVVRRIEVASLSSVASILGFLPDSYYLPSGAPYDATTGVIPPTLYVIRPQSASDGGTAGSPPPARSQAPQTQSPAHAQQGQYTQQAQPAHQAPSTASAPARPAGAPAGPQAGTPDLPTFLTDLESVIASWPNLDPMMIQKYGHLAPRMIQLLSELQRRIQPSRTVTHAPDSVSQSDKDLAANHTLLGIQYAGSDNMDLAIKHFQQAAQLDPSESVNFYYLGQCAQMKNDVEGAVQLFHKALELNPNHGDVLQRLSNLYLQKHLPEPAQQMVSVASQLKDDDPDLWNAVGLSYQREVKFYAARAAFKIAAEIKPMGEYFFNMALAEMDLKEFVNAVGHFRRASIIATHDWLRRLALTRLCESSHKLCEWRDFYTNLYALQDSVTQYVGEAYSEHRMWLIEPLFSLSVPWVGMHNASYIRKGVAMRKSKGIYEQTMASVPIRLRHEPWAFPKRVKIAYVSAGIGNHVSGIFLQSAIGLHSRREFEIYVYNQHVEQNNYIKRQIASECDHYISVYGVHFLEIAKRINADGIHIVVYLDPHTTGEKLDILAMKPAPINLHYFGYPGTTGASYVEYMITDHVVVSPEYSFEMTEKLMVQPAPFSYQVNNHRQILQNYEIKASSREQQNLPDDAIVFNVFNQLHKVTPGIFNIWTNILRLVPNGMLWMYHHSEAEAFIGKEVEAAGLQPSKKIGYASSSQHIEQLGRLQLADIFLDTPVYQAHTTLTDVLFCGVPPVVMQGEHMASRVAGGLLLADDVSELAVTSAKQYEDMAILLARNPDRLHHLKRFLRQNRLTSSLFDTAGWISNSETGFKMMWDLYIQGMPVHHIIIHR